MRRTTNRSFWATIVAVVTVAAACGTTTDGDPVPATADVPTTSAGAAPATTLPATTVAETTRDETSTNSVVTTSTTEATAAEGEEVQPCADVIDGTLRLDGDGTYTVSATVRSGDTGWDKYADAWIVQTADGEVLGERILLHPHETEQPFTRSLSGVVIPADVTTVVLAARDLVNGYCGETYEIAVDA